MADYLDKFSFLLAGGAKAMNYEYIQLVFAFELFGPQPFKECRKASRLCWTLRDEHKGNRVALLERKVQP